MPFCSSFRSRWKPPTPFSFFLKFLSSPKASCRRVGGWSLQTSCTWWPDWLDSPSKPPSIHSPSTSFYIVAITLFVHCLTRRALAGFSPPEFSLFFVLSAPSVWGVSFVKYNFFCTARVTRWFFTETQLWAEKHFRAVFQSWKYNTSRAHLRQSWKSESATFFFYNPVFWRLTVGSSFVELFFLINCDPLN